MHTHNHHSSDKKAIAACCRSRQKFDWLLWWSVVIVGVFSTLHVSSVTILSDFIITFSESTYTLLFKMWWGIILGVFSVGVLSTVPRELVMSVLGKGGSMNGVLRATLGGVLLDLCSHGILLVGTKLYERGASYGQMLAFLIASPWNSLSLTLILWSLVGFNWMITFLILSLFIAIIAGVIADHLVKIGFLPANPNSFDLPLNYSFWKGFKQHVSGIHWHPLTLVRVMRDGVKESTMILRWIFFGIVLAAFIRSVVPTELFTQLFGPTLLGLGATLLFATILEVCSEGSLPVATDMLLRAKAAGNSFAFLMTGVSTDYTEIMAIKETTGSWKMAFVLPLLTLPQVVVLSIILNSF